MTSLMIAALGALMVATAFLSGLFGMAGGSAMPARKSVRNTSAPRRSDKGSDSMIPRMPSTTIKHIAGAATIA